MIMDTTSPSGNNAQQQQSPAYALMKRGKRGAAALIAADCCNVAATIQPQLQEEFEGSDAAATAAALSRCKLLDNMLDVLLNPYDAIGEWNNLDWLRWLMAGGKTLDEFSSAVKDYDYGTCCGLVWTANYVAYRCRTCSISPCMSLCGECFKRGNHTGHDFNMFRSQAGGACDCGDTSVMKPDGFCRKHSSTNNIDDCSSSSNTGCKQPPADLLRVAERIMPRLLLRLVQYLRENSKHAENRTSVLPPGSAANQQQQNLLLADLDPFLGMLHDLSHLGAAMRRVMTVSLTNEKIYRWACDYYSSNCGNIVNSDPNYQQQQTQQMQQTIYTMYTDKVRRYYAEAIHQYTSSSSPPSGSRRRRLSNTTDIGSGDAVVGSNSSLSNSEDEGDNDELSQDEWIVDNKNSSGRKSKLNHSSFLQEIVFWTVRYEFPQKMVCLLLNMLPDAVYKEALTEAFVMHYGCVARVLATTRDSDTLSNHIVHISVQLFSNEALATRMVDKLGLLRVMVSSLRRMMTKILISSTLHEPLKNCHKVVDCSKAVMREHCYWPLVSDLNNVLSHRPIAMKFMYDDRLLESWFSYLSMFQGMNVNCRELGHHVEFEPNTYYAAFSAELEASAYPMWALLSHLTSTDTWPLTSRVLHACLQRLHKWLVDVGYEDYKDNDTQGSSSSTTGYQTTFNRRIASTIIQRPDDRHQFTFHLPLHRYLAVFLCQAIRAQGANIGDIIPLSIGDPIKRDALLLAIASHPMRAQAAFYEIMQGAWVRNGLQIKGQAMTYIQSNFCISMVDADIYLLQFCLSELSNANTFVSLMLEKFKVCDWMSIKNQLPQVMDSDERDVAPSMESLLVFLATLVGVRTNLCTDEDYDYCQSQLEMVTLLCVSDKTHSQLMELMPERCGSGTQNTSPTATTASSGDNASQNLPPSDKNLPPSPRDFETVLQAVAEYKRPQFEASGNMQQGLYVPLAHVWQNLYDPVHVLLRAVHRRDFQSSMDRYTAFMRSIGVLKQNQTPWPPYRTPQKHNSAYRDPRRALQTRLFHAVAWHCLYRSAIAKDVSEHTLGLLIYLLDQAWICYNSSSSSNVSENQTTNEQQPMDTDPPTETKFTPFTPSAASTRECIVENSIITTDGNKCPLRHIKIPEVDTSKFCYQTKDQDKHLLLLDRWYGDDDLVQNLCTTITHIELPPPYVSPSVSTVEEQPEPSLAVVNTSTSTASAMATNIIDYFTSSVGAVTSSTTGASSSTAASNVVETDNSLQQQNAVVPSLATMAGMVNNEIVVPVSLSSQSPNTDSATRPPFYSFNAAAAATSTTMDNALSRVKQRLQFLRPPLPKTTLPTTNSHQQQLASSSSSSEHQVQQVGTDVETQHSDFVSLIDADVLGIIPIQDIDYDDGLNDKRMWTDGHVQRSESVVSINESIISLLLRLHSHLSGKPDSYQPPLPTSLQFSDLINEAVADNFVPTSVADNHDKREVPPCGDGAFYVGRLLDKIASGSKLCYECVVHTRLALWPKAVVMRETATREDEERERCERKRRARDKQRQMMEEMARAQRAFIESARRSGDLDSEDAPSEPQVQLQLTGTSTTITPNTATVNMDCDEPAAIMDVSTTATTSSGITATSSLSIVAMVDVDENSSSSNSTTSKEPVGFRNVSHQESTPTVDCVICNQTVVVQTEQQRKDPVGLVILVQGTNILAHRRQILLPTAIKNQQNVNCTTDSHKLLQQQQRISTAATVVTNSILNNMSGSTDDNEQNYYRYWPALPPSQTQYQQQLTTTNENHDLQQQHLQSTMTVVEDDDTTTFAAHSDRRRELMSEYFTNLDKADLEIGAATTTASNTKCWGNVHVQTCGHHLHLRCWRSYLTSLRGAQRFASDRGEYSCPLCRQLANSVMPLMPIVAFDHHRYQTTANTTTSKNLMSESMNIITDLIEQQRQQNVQRIIVPVIPARSVSESTNTSSIISLLAPDEQPAVNHNQPHHRFQDGGYLPEQNVDNEGGEDDSDSETEILVVHPEEDLLFDSVSRCVDDMITSTSTIAASTTTPLVLFAQEQRKVTWFSVISVAWTNIQVELVQRDNTLIEQLWKWPLNRRRECSTIAPSTDSSGSNNYYNMLPKRNCMAPLLKLLSVRARSLMMSEQQREPNFNPLGDIWNKLIGLRQPQQHCSYTTNPPLLLRDPCSILIQLLLLLPPIEGDLFDTLVKLTYNMQIYAAALKVAVTWNRNHSRQRYQSRASMAEEILMSSDNTRMDLCCSSASTSMEVTRSGEALSAAPFSSFSQAIALAKTIVLSQDISDTIDVNSGTIVDDDEFMMFQDDHFNDDGGQQFTSSDDGNSDDKMNVSVTLRDINEENLLLLESYGRQCCLPFLRFATLLKKYTFENNTDHLDEHHELTTVLSPQRHGSNINCKAKQHKPQDHGLDSRTRINHDGQHSPTAVAANFDNSDLKKNPSNCRRYCRRHWSRDDYEFFTLARYLKLLDCNKVYYNDSYDEENFEHCYYCEDENQDCKSGSNDDRRNLALDKTKCAFTPPSAMDAVNWPEPGPSFSTDTSCGDNDASSLIARSWLTSVRDSLTTKPAPVPCPGEASGAANAGATSSVATATGTATASAVVIMAVRQLLAVDGTGSGAMASGGRLPLINWMGPRLLKLPHLYDDVFQYYHGRPCHRCHGVPRETSVCLVCGTVVCLKENCCKTNNTCEAVQHSMECGGGTAMFLVVTSSSVVVVRGKRACLWGSVYLDAFGEEDRELKRGKPLYLSPERYRLLERQWLAHRFDHTNKKWVWHRDAL